MDVVNWLIDEGHATSQGDVAAQAGLGANAISRIKNGLVKEVSEVTIRALVNHFDVLNIDYLRGKSEYISKLQKSSAALDAEIKTAQELRNQMPPSPNYLDQSSILNTALAAQASEIETLKQTIADINEHHKREIAAKDAHIADLTKLADERLHRITELRRVIDANQMSEFPFPVGVAEKYKRI